MANTPQLIKFDVCLYKKEDQPEEEFFHWATKVYPGKAAALIKKYSIVKWSQVRSITTSMLVFHRTSCMDILLPTIPTKLRCTVTNAASTAQTIQPVQFREPLRHTLKTAMGRPGWTIPDYDMVTTYWLRSLDDMQALTTDPEWAELEKEACTKCNMSIGHFVVGHEIVHFENNEAAASS